MRFAPGECLRHYVIESELGAGGMGQVFLARDTRCDAQSPSRCCRVKSPARSYEYYLKGVATFSSVGSASANVTGNVDAGIKLLERAVAIDPNYALAHAQLAWGEMWLATINGDAVAFARGREALARADGHRGRSAAADGS